MELIFAALMIAGLAYLLLMIIGLGDIVDIDVDGIGDVFGGDATGFGCGVIAAFLAAFGATGLTGMALGLSIPLIIVLALIVGYALGRIVLLVLKYVYAQQSGEVEPLERLIGTSARVTLDAETGSTGEILVESDEVARYPVREINNAELKRGDIVEIVDVQGRYLRVKKKRG